MKRALNIAAIMLLLAQAMGATVPMLHPAPTPTKIQSHGKHACCPKPAVRLMTCCEHAVACPLQHHGAGACCCADSGQPAVPTRESSLVPHRSDPPAANAQPDLDARLPAATSPLPLDNSPPVLVLRN